MRTIMSRCPHESSFSFSKRHIQWIVGKVTGEGSKNNGYDETENDEEEEDILTFSTSTTTTNEEPAEVLVEKKKKKKKKKKKSQIVSVIRSVFTPKNRPSKLTGTLFGHRRGHVHIAFQLDRKLSPIVLIELAVPTSTLVREMASGLVRVALECEHKGYDNNAGKVKEAVKLLEETLWRAYCNGKKCGYAVRRECGPEDWKVIKAVGPVSMGAGVLPGPNEGGDEGEMMYMRARFERVVGSKDSEAFYMMNPDGNSGPELSIYFLRV